MSDRVTLRDLRNLKYCMAGSRIFCKLHGISVDRLIREGIPISEVEHIDDAMLKKIIEHARNREDQ